MSSQRIALQIGTWGRRTLASGLLLGSLCVSGLSSSSHAADAVAADIQPTSEAGRLVLTALLSEADGDLVTRDRLLETAAKTDAWFAPAQWHRGLVMSKNGSWETVESQLSQQRTSDELESYEAKRLVAPNTALGQWQLAVWCLRNEYIDQGRAHLQRTIDLDPEHRGARQLLGFRLMGDQWISPLQVGQMERRATDIRVGLQKYGKQLTQLARDFKTRKESVRSEAREALLEIKDPIAIGPVEAILAPLGGDAAKASLDWLNTIPDPEATQSMVRFGLFHPQTSIREQAVIYVQKRPLHDYVPELLDMLSLPVAAMAMPVIGADGTLTGFRQAFAQERKGEREVFVLDTQINYSVDQQPPQRRQSRLAAPNRVGPRATASPTDPLSQIEALERASTQVRQTSAQVQEQNQRIALRNQAVATFLSEVSNLELSTPSELWKWWDEVNETESQSLKLSNVRYESSTLTTRNYNELAAAAATGPVQTLASECFARGTPVITRKGPRSIETVRVGDLVLSRNVQSGELSWKAVVRTTIRPARPLFELSLDSETVRCTGGHLFWVSGKGWTKASQIQAGDVLHGASQPIAVMKVTQKPDEETFNLAVDQTQTYFVGKQMVLSHDVTDRVPTHIKVPGLTPTAP